MLVALIAAAGNVISGVLLGLSVYWITRAAIRAELKRQNPPIIVK
jgi:hypothetical protein